MSEAEHFALHGVQVRSLEERIIEGRAIPYGEEIKFRGRTESFAKGAAAHLDLLKTKLRRSHETTIGRVVETREANDGLYLSFRVSKTVAGDEALEMAADGTLDGLSPGFVADTTDRNGTITKLRALPEVSLVDFQAYPSAQVLAVRKEPEMGEAKATEAIETPEGTPEGTDNTETRTADLGSIEKRMTELGDQITKLDEKVSTATPAKPGDGPTLPEWFAAEMRAKVLGDLETRAKVAKAIETRQLADVTGELGSTADAGGLVQEAYLASQLVHVLDARRPFFASLGAFPAPRSGYAKIPIVTQSTLVDDRTGQKLEANSQALIVENRSFEAKWFDGAVDVALELIQTSDPSVIALLWDDLSGQYAIKTEADALSIFAADVALGAAHQFTYTGGVLPTTTYGEFAAAVATQAMAVRTATGAPATRLAIPTALWPDVIAFVDANDRRQFAAMGSTNADAVVSLTAESFSLPGGITVFWADVDAAVLYNETALRAADYGITRVEALNVTAMGRDMGVLGRTMVVPRIPAGVVVFDTEPA